jgi:hypothetical protein
MADAAPGDHCFVLRDLKEAWQQLKSCLAARFQPSHIQFFSCSPLFSFKQSVFFKMLSAKAGKWKICII